MIINIITNENIGVYKGVILNPKKYLEVNETLLSTTGKVDSIIK
ncbi:MAG: hypothetical protein PHH98_00165 [Candidatus Gracilibacteria bacterium]|nr:hypothetical protein [Candidatus Gracilibacteria bacterium]